MPLADDRSRVVTERGPGLLLDLFHRGGVGTRMTMRSVEGLLDERRCEALAGDLLEALGAR